MRRTEQIVVSTAALASCVENFSSSSYVVKSALYTPKQLFALIALRQNSFCGGRLRTPLSPRLRMLANCMQNCTHGGAVRSCSALLGTIGPCWQQGQCAHVRQTIVSILRGRSSVAHPFQRGPLCALQYIVASSLTVIPARQAAPAVPSPRVIVHA